MSVPPRAERNRDKAVSAFTALERRVGGRMRDKMRSERAEAVRSILQEAGVSAGDCVIERPLTKSEVRTLRSIVKGNTQEGRSSRSRSFADKTEDEAREILRQDMIIRQAMSGLEPSIASLVKLDDESMWSGEYGVAVLKEAMDDPLTEGLAKGVLISGTTIAAVRGSGKLADEVLSRSGLGSTSDLLSEPARLGALVGCANASVASAFVKPMIDLHSILDPTDVRGMSQTVLRIASGVGETGIEGVAPIPVSGKITSAQRAVLEDTLVSFSASLALRSGDAGSEKLAAYTFRMQYAGLSDAQICGLAYEMLESASAMVDSVGFVAQQVHAADFQRAMRAVDGMTEEAAAILESSNLNENIRKHVERDGGETLLRMLSMAERDIKSNPDKHQKAILNHAKSIISSIDSTVLAGTAGEEATKQASDQIDLANQLVSALSKGNSNTPLALVLIEAQRAAVSSIKAEKALRDAANAGADDPVRQAVTDLVNTSVIGLASGSEGLRGQRLTRATEMARAVGSQEDAKAGVESVQRLAVAAVSAAADPSIMPIIHHSAEPARKAAAGRDWRTGSRNIENTTLATMLSQGWEIE